MNREETTMPDYNVNRNSMNALKTTSSSYMQHNAIPSLFFNGENNFSVEVFFYLKSKELGQSYMDSRENLNLELTMVRYF